MYVNYGHDKIKCIHSVYSRDVISNHNTSRTEEIEKEKNAAITQSSRGSFYKDLTQSAFFPPLLLSQLLLETALFAKIVKAAKREGTSKEEKKKRWKWDKNAKAQYKTGLKG